jgi:CRISPR-associated protein Cas1
MSELYRYLGQLRWHALSLSLRSLNDYRDHEHGLAVFQSLLKNAAPAAGRIRESGFVFHPLVGKISSHLNKGAVQQLEIVFPSAVISEIQQFIKNLHLHLEDRQNGFVLETCGTIRKRSLENLLSEQGALPGNAEELCLDFITPFSFRPSDSKRRWMLAPEEFCGFIVERLKSLFSIDVGPWAGNFSELILFPYYWPKYLNFKEKHQSKSSDGEKLIKGMVGPLFVRGNLAALYPLLLIASELHFGQKTTYGQGYCRLAVNAEFFDRKLRFPGEYRRVVADIDVHSDISGQIAREYFSRETLAREMCASVAAGTYRSRPAHGRMIPKKSAGSRMIVTLEPRDYVLHKLLHAMLSPVVEKMLEESSVGFRVGRSREKVREMIADACQQGYRYVLESDIASFFDDIDWSIMMAKLKSCLPVGDRRMIALLETCLQTDVEIKGKVVHRSRGLLQGSPLSPLLSNLYLDSFDEEMARRGYRLVRYGDDFIVLTTTMEEAARALVEVKELLGKLKLRLKNEKTFLKPLDIGFSFLGLDFSAGLDEEFIENSTLRKPLFIQPRYAFIGLDYDSIIIRKGGRLLARLPIKRIGEIIVFGTNTLSSKLLHKCSREKIPVSFCSATGYYVNTLRPDSKRYFAIAVRHHASHEALGEEEIVSLAGEMIAAKIKNYLAWLKKRYNREAGRSIGDLERLIDSLKKADTVEQVLGYEGRAAGWLFPFIVSLIRVPGFLKSKPQQEKREKRKKEDRFNSLLDFAYFLLFTRINVLLLSQGLNPYLGILHSHKDYFESLSYDLVEPFRCRMDRMVLKLINLKMIKVSDFYFDQKYGWRLKPDGVGVFLDAFERELDTRRSGDAGTLKQLLYAQVKVVAKWVDGEAELIFYGNSKSR